MKDNWTGVPGDLGRPEDGNWFRAAKEQLKDDVSIYRFLAPRSVEVKKNRLICPFCGGGSTSEDCLTVTEDEKGFRCQRRTCGESGDLLKLAMELDGTAFRATVLELCVEFGVLLPTPSRRRDSALSKKSALLKKARHAKIKRLALRHYASLFQAFVEEIPADTPEEAKNYQQDRKHFWDLAWVLAVESLERIEERVRRRENPEEGGLS